MNILDLAIRAVSPRTALARARDRQALAHYDAAGSGTRTKHWRRDATSADAAAGRRDRLSFSARDLVRNTAFAERGVAVIAAAVVGEGIAPKITGGSEAARKRIAGHLSSRDIDADGRNSLAGLQKIIMRAVVTDGEVLVRRRRRQSRDGLRVPVQLQVLEVDFLDRLRYGEMPNGNFIDEGIEYDQIGRRVAYWLFDQHPGGRKWPKSNFVSRRVDASEILHIYEADRPGQMRGVSWLSPVMLELKDLHEYQEAQIIKQKVSACFAGFRRMPDDPANMSEEQVVPSTLKPGMIGALGPGEDMVFGNPPTVDGYDEFMRRVLHSIAAGLGITYQALSGDLSQTSWTSYRAGAIQMDRNVACWQRQIMIAQLCDPISEWIADATGLHGRLGIEWTPPRRPMLDPSKEIPALIKGIEGGIMSLQGTIRQIGGDPDQIMREQIEDATAQQNAGLRFTSSAYEEEPEPEKEDPGNE